MGSHVHAAREKLTADLRNVVHDTEELLREVGDGLTDKGKEARARLMSNVQTAKATCHDLQDKTVVVARAADEYVHENPYKSAGVAFGIGMLMGVLIARK
jgi:ElaB/YqjD/DUF883 family membrane-anchored ribosome-binding protein